jgi:hypothetical protein
VTGPYAAAADAYWQAGWRGILPLPPAAKKPPPDGWTGHGAPYPSYPDIHTWTEDRGAGNLAIRLPADLLGIDVDAYDGKPGAQTLTDLEIEHGPLPATWTSTSRDDGISAIRLFRVPVGVNWVGALPGIETIHAGHRYLVAAPSVHPDTGRKYEWRTPAGRVADRIPGPADLPELPLPWVAGLARPRQRTNPADLGAGGSATWLRHLRPGPQCPPVALLLAETVRRLADPAGGARHDLALSASRALAGFGGEGHAGVYDALGQLGNAFVVAASNPAHGGETRSTSEATAEYRDLLLGAIRLAAAGNPQPDQACGCETDQDLYDLVGEVPHQRDQPRQEPPANQAAVRLELDVTNPAVAADWLRDQLGRGQLAGMFLRADDLVFTPREGEDGYIPLSLREKDNDGPAQIRVVTAPGLAAAVSYRYRCSRTAITRNGNQITRPALFPPAAAQTAANALDMMRHLRRLRGATHTPVVRADGSILTAAGYDPETRLLHLPEPGLTIPPVPVEPSVAELAAAVALLQEMTAGFPFLTDHDRANIYGALLTPLLRLLTPPPYKLVAIGAPMPGSGKSLLASMLRIVHGGVFRSEMPEDDAELRKQITAILDVTTGPVVQFDNVSGMLTSSTLAGLLTSNRWDDRRLGVNEMVSRPNDRLWVLTGNNLLIGGDLPRRTLWVTIDPAMPEPHRRTGFAIENFELWVRQRRGQIVAALLTMTCSWVVAGMPRSAADRSDSYAGWITTLRGILGNAGIDGTLDHPDSSGETAGEDEWGVFLDAVHRVFGDATWTVPELLDRVGIVHAASIPVDALPGDLSEKTSKGSNPHGLSRSLGKWLRNREGRWANGKAARRRGQNRAGANLWQIVTYERSSAGSAGFAGSSSGPNARERQDDLGQGETGPTDPGHSPHSPHSPHQWPDW